MVNVEFFHNFDDGSWWLSTDDGIFKAFVSFVKLLEPPLHCVFVSFWAKCIVEVVSVSAVLWLVLNLNKKTDQTCSLSNIIYLR